MPSWLLKTTVHHVLKALPHPEWWNGLMQRHVTRGLQLEPYGEFLDKLVACRQHFRNYLSYSTKPADRFSVIEVGTGWFPIIPIGLHLCGAKEVLTFDIARLLQRDTFAMVVEYFCQFARTGELYRVLPEARVDLVSEFIRLAHSSKNLSPIEFLKCLRIRPVLGDVRALPVEDKSVDLVFSHGVLEHFPLQFLTQATAEFYRVCADSSIMSHFIGIKDQFSSFDHSITQFNNLRYSERAWQWLDSPIIPQNRLRVSDYIHVFRNAGFEVSSREDIKAPESELNKTKVSQEFLRYSRDELLVLYSWLVGCPRESQSAA